MPSSSNRNTHLEREILKLFRQTHLRLSEVRAKQPNEYLTGRFADLLEVTPEELVAQRNEPVYNVGRMTAKEIIAKRKAWYEFRMEVEREKRDVNIVGAAECLHWVGAALEVRS